MRGSLLERIGVTIPIMQAPMAGGVTTPALVAAVSARGGLGAIGAAYYPAQQLENEMLEIRRRTDKPFAVNLFSGGEEPENELRASLVEPQLRAFRRELRLPEEVKPPPRDSIDARFELILKHKPRVMSFTFGLLPPEKMRALREREILIVGTATNLAEARALEESGVDAIAAQGGEAGGHRGTFIGSANDSLAPMMELVPLLLRGVKTPVIAAGGMMDGEAISRALALGAAAVQLGTAFLNTDEAGTAKPWRTALTDGMARETVITRAYSGRAARAIRNRFTDAFANREVAPYPQQQQLTKDLRAAATAQSRPDLMQMLVGEGAPRVRSLPAAKLIDVLLAEAGL